MIWQYAAATATLIVGSTVYLFRSWFLNLITPRGVPGIPAYNDPSPIMGDLPRMTAAMKKNDNFSDFFDQVGHDLGPVGQIRLAGLKTMIIVNDYQEAERILNSHKATRAAHTMETFTNIVPLGQIALPTNDMWKHHRRLIGPTMTSRSLSAMTPTANNSIRELIDLVEAKMQKAQGRSFAIEQDFVSSTMDVICGMAFGESWGVVRDCTEQVMSSSPKPGPSGEAIFETERPKLAESTIRLLDSVPDQVCLPWTSKANPAMYAWVATATTLTKGDSAVELAANALDMMIAREMRGDFMADQEIMEEILLYLVAGTETSAVTMTWYLKYMTNHPEVQRKLRDHLIDRIPELQDRELTFDDVAATKVPYLEAVVQECLRLSRTAGGFAREATVDMTVLGYHVPKGSIIITPSAFQCEDTERPTWSDGTGNSSAISLTKSLDEKREETGRRVGYWKGGSGKQFIPERWIRDGEFDANAGPSLPFSSGQRGCFGKNLALLELRLVIAQLTLAFFFAPVPEALNSQDWYEVITRHARQSFINPQRW